MWFPFSSIVSILVLMEVKRELGNNDELLLTNSVSILVLMEVKRENAFALQSPPNLEFQSLF